MSDKTATTVVMFTGLILIGLALMDKRNLNDPGKYKRVWAAGVTMTALAFAKDVAPDLTGWFALAVLTGATVVQRNVISDFITTGSGQTAKPQGGKK